MSDVEEFEAPFVVTLKGGAGYEKPWIVIRGNTAEEAITRLGEAKLHGLLEKTAEFAADFQAQTGAAPASAAPVRSTGTPPRSGQAPQGAAPTSEHDGAPHPEGLTCPVDNQAIVGKTITSKSGKNAGRKFEMWVCPNQRSRDDGHFAEFIN